jgi:alkaline phosphatase D
MPAIAGDIQDRWPRGTMPMTLIPNPVRFHRRIRQRLSRRQLLNIAWKAGASALALPLADTRVFAQMAFQAYPFSLGVASGDPWPDGVVLWTRLAPEPLAGGGMPMASVEVTWEVAAERAFRTIVQKGVAVARPELGHSVHVEVDGLQPGREYFYRFRAGREVSQVGRTRTAPAPGAAVDQLRFGVCGCSHLEHGFFTAYRHLARQQFDFVFHTGDYIYEGRANNGQNDPRVREHAGQEIYTVVDYRNRYAQYKMDPDLRAAHASAPFIMTWDDHEVDNDYAGAIDESGETPPEVFLLRRAAAYQAYYEAMPIRAASLPAGPDMLLYRHFSFGRLLDLSALDTRQYRSDQACGGGARTDCAAAADPGRTMFGAAQERWLFERLGRVRATWTVLGQQVPTFARDYQGTAPDARFQMDKWDGYVAARDRLFTRLVETAAPNPVVLSGDVHLHYAADLRRDFARPESPVIGVELTNSSITSNGDGADLAGGWDVLQRHNPHLRFNSARRGYISCTVSSSDLRADFRVVDRVTIPDAPERSAGTWVVEAGRPGLVAG